MIFWVCWVPGRRQTHFDVRFVVDCPAFPSENISSCLQPKCSPQEMQDGRFEKLRGNCNQAMVLELGCGQLSASFKRISFFDFVLSIVTSSSSSLPLFLFLRKVLQFNLGREGGHLHFSIWIIKYFFPLKNVLLLFPEGLGINRIDFMAFPHQ